MPGLAGEWVSISPNRQGTSDLARAARLLRCSDPAWLRRHLARAGESDGLLVATAAIVAVLSFLAGHRLHVTLLVVLPVVLFNMQFLRGPMSPPTREFKFLLYGALRAFNEAKGPLIFALIGWGIGSVTRGIARRPPV